VTELTGRDRATSNSALITGGAGGIGRALANRLGDRGFAVTLADIDGERGPEVAAAAGARFAAADVRDQDSLEAAVAAAETAGPLRAVFLNAGFATGHRSVEEIGLDEYRRVMQVNLDGTFLGLRAALPALRRAGGGAVVVTASLAGVSAWPGDPVYVASKHAVVGLVQAAAPSLIGDDVTLSVVCPGFVDTPMVPAEFRDTGFPLLTAADVAAALLDAADTAEPGEIRIVQPGVGAIRYTPRGVPAARAADGSKPVVPTAASG
jgi:NAD(P)-dependent dehydrogenase (short-subunit alcohol dehydrogenase family)